MQNWMTFCQVSASSGHVTPHHTQVSFHFFPKYSLCLSFNLCSIHSYFSLSLSLSSPFINLSLTLFFLTIHSSFTLSFSSLFIYLSLSIFLIVHLSFTLFHHCTFIFHSLFFLTVHSSFSLSLFPLCSFIFHSFFPFPSSFNLSIFLFFIHILISLLFPFLWISPSLFFSSPFSSPQFDLLFPFYLFPSPFLISCISLTYFSNYLVVDHHPATFPGEREKVPISLGYNLTATHCSISPHINAKFQP